MRATAGAGRPLPLRSRGWDRRRLALAAVVLLAGLWAVAPLVSDRSEDWVLRLASPELASLLGAVTAIVVASALLRTSLYVTGLAGVAAAHLFFGDLDIGPFSARVYLLGGLSLLLLADVATGKRKLFANGWAVALVAIYGLFILWAGLNSYYVGNSAASVARVLFANHVMALAVFVIVQATVRTRREMVLLAALLGVTVVISASFAVLQWFGTGWAWDAVLRLHPGQETKTLATRFDPNTFGFVPGLSLFSVPLSYHLITFGPLVMAWAVLRHRTSRPARLAAVAAAALIVFAIVLSQARSALLATFVVVVLLVWQPVSGRLDRGQRRLAALLTIGLVSLGLVWALGQTNTLASDSPEAGQGRYSLGRILDFNSSNRQALFDVALESSARHLFLGDVNSYLETAYPGGEQGNPDLPTRVSAPHNLIANALVFYGAPGLTLIVLLVLVLAGLSWRALRAAREDPAMLWLTTGLVLGLVGFLVNAQFHNSSFVTGDLLPWWPIGLMASMAARGRAA